MTDEALAALKVEIATTANAIGATLDAVDPELAPFVLLGKGLALAAPDLLNDAQKLLAGEEPSEADVAALAEKIAALEAPETL